MSQTKRERERCSAPAPQTKHRAGATVHPHDTSGTPSTVNTEQDVLLTRQETAALLRKHIASVDRDILEGRLPAYRVGRSVRVWRRDALGLLVPMPAPLAP